MTTHKVSERPTADHAFRVAVRLRPRVSGERGTEHFKPTTPTRDLARIPWVGRMLHKRPFQFLLILPNQVIFWLVIFAGVLGVANPNLNFGTVITWYVWFFLVFVTIILVGRAWCVMCPFGGAGEWVQRRTMFRRKTGRPLTLGIKLPESWAGYGLVTSALMFIFLTYIEEFFNIAGPGKPINTTWLVLGIIGTATAIFLIFERRTFCRYICPLSGMIGTLGATGMVAGFRTRDFQICLNCETKDCMRGGETGYGCPWYTWPGSADTNLECGLCTECYKACPYDNVGLFVQKPMTSVVEPIRRRLDVAWVVALLFGLIVFQQVNALGFYDTVDNWLNRYTGWPAYPNPIDYLGTIALGVAFLVVATRLIQRVGAANGSPAAVPDEPSLMAKSRRFFGQWFEPLMYGMIPLVAADYLARQMPKFFDHGLRIVPAVANVFGGNPGLKDASSLYNTPMLTTDQLVATQVVVMIIGSIASAWAMYRIWPRSMSATAKKPTLALTGALTLVLVVALATTLIYIPMQGAQ